VGVDYPIVNGQVISRADLHGCTPWTLLRQFAYDPEQLISVISACSNHLLLWRKIWNKKNEGVSVRETVSSRGLTAAIRCC